MPTMVFGGFALDITTGELRRGKRVVRLGPHPLKVLIILAGRAGELVRREEIEQALWEDGTSVDFEHGVNTCISQLRRALGDRASRPRFIETVPRRGYRFKAQVLRGSQPHATSVRLIGRDQPLRTLHHVYAEVAATRSGRVVTISGEPGIGKTTIANAFVAALSTESSVRPRVGRGRCSERLTGTEAYLPWLEAIEDLIRSDDTGEAGRLLQAEAPTWRATVASEPVGPAEPPDQQVQTRSQSQEQLKRELAAWLRRIAERQPVVIHFEDLHWADTSTIDLIAYLAGRFDDLPLMLLTTHRETELLLSGHPFATIRLELQARGSCLPVPLSLWTAEDVSSYLTAAYRGHAFPVPLATVLHDRTEGSPLFVVDSIEYLRATGAISRSDDRWSLVGPLPALERDLPQSIASMIERKLSLVGEGELELLRVAAVQGYDFDSTTVADALSADRSTVERRLDTLARVHTVIRQIGERRLTSGSVTVAYRFVHVLYQHALFAQVTPTRRAALSLAIAEALLVHVDAHSREVAPLLARLFEAGGDARRGIDFALIAARQAVSMFANHEVVALIERALTLLPAIADVEQRRQRELELRMTLGPALTALQGWAADAVGDNFARAQSLCEQRTDSRETIGPLLGLHSLHLVRAHLAEAHRLSERLSRLIEPLGDPLLTLRTYGDLGVTLFPMGQLPAAQSHLSRCLSLYDPAVHHDRQIRQFGFDSGAIASACYAYSELLAGHPERAAAALDKAEAYGQPHPFTAAVVGAFGALTWFTRGDVEATRKWSIRIVALSEEHGFAGQAAFGAFFLGWARAAHGCYDDGVAEMEDAERRLTALGNDIYLSARLLGLAQAHSQHGQPRLAQRTLDAAEAFIERSGERLYEPEVYRLRGTLAIDAGDHRTAAPALARALALARAHGTLLFERRAAAALARYRPLSQDHGPVAS